MEKINGELYTGYGNFIYLTGWNSFVEMTCSNSRLDFTSGSGLLIKDSFLKEDIISIEPFIPSIPIRNKGIIIKHKIKNYHPCYIFTSSKETPNNLIEKIKRTGFMDGNISKIDPQTINEVRSIQSNKLPSFIKFYIILIIIFVASYLIFGWNFLDKIL